MCMSFLSALIVKVLNKSKGIVRIQLRKVVRQKEKTQVFLSLTGTTVDNTILL